MSPRLASLVLVSLFAGSLAAQTVTVSASPNPAIFGKPVTLTANASSGTQVTFYDGVQPLGIANISGGIATFKTQLLNGGPNTITARIDGTSALSAPINVTVNDLVALNYNTLNVFPIGTNPNFITVGDFNGDGNLDVAATLAQTTQFGNYVNGVVVMLGTGAGSFNAPITALTDGGAYDVVTADFNGDGKLDLAVTVGVQNGSGAGVDILLGNGDGTFQVPVHYVFGNALANLAVGDFNADGALDLAVTDLGGDVWVLLNNGNGSFATPADYPNAATSPGPIAVGDFNKDGKTDLALADEVGSTVVIMFGNGDGTFPTSNYPAYSVGDDVDPQSLAVADFNGDGAPDIVTVNPGDAINGNVGSGMSVLINNGAGVFTVTGYNTVQLPQAVWAEDVNGDGKPDIVVGDIYQENSDGTTFSPALLEVFLNQGNGTFPASSNTYPGGYFTASLEVADFNNDGIPDVIGADIGDFTQTGNPGALDYWPGATCTYNVTPNPIATDSNAVVENIAIATSSPSCSWTVTSSQSWLQVISGQSGTGSGAPQISIQTNFTGADRSATITVGATIVNVTQAGTAEQFNDVPPSAYYFDAVNELKAKGITAGCGGADYCPQAVVSRDEMAIFIVRAVLGGDNFTYDSNQVFQDVPPSYFAFKWIQKLYELGITAGCQNNPVLLYCPMSAVGRDQMALFIDRARYGATFAFPYSTTPIFTDVPPADFAFPWIQRLSEDSITAGCGPGLYCPGNPVIRGDMAIFVMRGAFNQLLAPTAPVIGAVSPNTVALGGSATLTVTGINTNFLQGATTVSIPGATVGQFTVNSPTSITVQITAPATAPLQPSSVVAVTGNQVAVLPNAITYP